MVAPTEGYLTFSGGIEAIDGSGFKFSNLIFLFFFRLLNMWQWDKYKMPMRQKQSGGWKRLYEEQKNDEIVVAHHLLETIAKVLLRSFLKNQPHLFVGSVNSWTKSQLVFSKPKLLHARYNRGAKALMPYFVMIIRFPAHVRLRYKLARTDKNQGRLFGTDNLSLIWQVAQHRSKRATQNFQSCAFKQLFP